MRRLSLRVLPLALLAAVLAITLPGAVGSGRAKAKAKEFVVYESGVSAGGGRGQSALVGACAAAKPIGRAIPDDEVRKDDVERLTKLREAWTSGTRGSTTRGPNFPPGSEHDRNVDNESASTCRRRQSRSLDHDV